MCRNGTVLVPPYGFNGSMDRVRLDALRGMSEVTLCCCGLENGQRLPFVPLRSAQANSTHHCRETVGISSDNPTPMDTVGPDMMNNVR